MAAYPLYNNVKIKILWYIQLKKNEFVLFMELRSRQRV